MFQKKVVEKSKTHILCSITFLRNCAVYEVMWKHILERGRPQVAIWHMRIVCWMPKNTNTPPQYTGYTQKNGAVSKVNNKFIPHLTRAQRTLSAAATV